MRWKTIKIIRLIQQKERFYIFFMFGKMLSISAIALLTVYFPKFFISMLQEEVQYTKIVSYIGVYGSLLFALNGFRNYCVNKCRIFEEEYVKKMKAEIGSIVMTLPMGEVESPKLKDELAIANNAADLIRSVSLFQDICSDIITAVGFIYIIVRLEWLFLVLVSVVVAIKIYSVKRTVKYSINRRKTYAENDRKGNYLTKVAYYSAGAAKEIRVNRLEKWFMGKVLDYRNEMLRYQYEDFNKYAMFDIISVVVFAIQSLLILGRLSWSVVEGRIDIADFTMYYAAVTSLTETFTHIISKYGEFGTIKLNYDAFETIRQKRATDNGDESGHQELETVCSIEFDHVSFSYPNSDNVVLKDVCFKIQAGQKVALVGVNGSGKTTLIKLLCRFYRPTSGKILLNDVDIWTLSEKQYYAHISAVFQDYMTFAFSIKENITLSEQTEIVPEVLAWEDIYDWINRLERKENTVVSTRFDKEGINVSGGEEQKMAVLRAVQKEAPIILLDEPTKAMDAKTEAELYRSFAKVAMKKTCLLVSHRLGSATICDQIVLLEQGRIAEKGSHMELMQLRGKYAEMFELQGKAYEQG